MRSLFILLIFAALLCNSHAGTDATRFPITRGDLVVREMNLARQHPEIYARFLEAWRPKFHRKIRRLSDRAILRTREGVGAVNEAIRFLRRARPLAPLAISRGLTLAAAEHSAEQADGSIGHRGSHSSNPAERMNHHGIWRARCGENIFYGKGTARDVVLALIVDDGLPERKHRQNIFNPAFRYAGAAFGPHARYVKVCSIDFAAGYVESDAEGRSRFAPR